MIFHAKKRKKCRKQTRERKVHSIVTRPLERLAFWFLLLFWFSLRVLQSSLSLSVHGGLNCFLILSLGIVKRASKRSLQVKKFSLLQTLKINKTKREEWENKNKINKQPLLYLSISPLSLFLFLCNSPYWCDSPPYL